MINIETVKRKINDRSLMRKTDAEKITEECWSQIEHLTGFSKKIFERLKEPKYFDLEIIKNYDSFRHYETLYYLVDDLDTIDNSFNSIAYHFLPYFFLVANGAEDSEEAKKYLKMLNAAIVKYVIRKGFVKKGERAK